MHFWLRIGTVMGVVWGSVAIAQQPFGKSCFAISPGRSLCLTAKGPGITKVLRDTLHASPSLEAVFSIHPQFVTELILTQEYDTGVSTLVTSSAACVVLFANEDEPHRFPFYCRFETTRDGVAYAYLRGFFEERYRSRDNGSSTRLENNYVTRLTLERLSVDIQEIRVLGDPLDLPSNSVTLFPTIRP